MARLTAAQRRALPNSAFAGPGRSFPVNDRIHAEKALQLIGNAPASARGRIRSRARKVLGTKKKATRRGASARGRGRAASARRPSSPPR